MAALVPAIHAFAAKKKNVDARDERGHDKSKSKNKGPGKMPGPSGHDRWVGGLDCAGGMTCDPVYFRAPDIDIGELAVIEPHQFFVGPLISAPALVEPDNGSPEQHVESPSSLAEPLGIGPPLGS